ncbi:Alpha-galactosidase (Melibiase), partial [Durusdinium trenchii]
ALFDVKSNCREQLAEMMKLGRQVILAGDLLGMSVAVKLPLANASLSLPDLAN